MSDHQKENEQRIAAYLQNRLSPEEREAFKRSLSEDDELRLQYVDALMNRAGTEQSSGASGGTVTGGESSAGETVSAAGPAVEADVAMPEAVVGTGELEEHAGEAGQSEEVSRGSDEPGEGGEGVSEGSEPLGGWQTVGEQSAREAWEAGWPGGKRKTKGGFLGSGWMVGVTALILIIAGVVIYILTKHHEIWERAVAAISADSGDVSRRNRVDSSLVDAGSKQAAGTAGKADTIAVAAGGRASAGGGAGEAGGAAGKLADSVYATLYKPYMRGDDPVEVRASYQDYRTGNYAAVLAADSMVGGAATKNYQLRNYMRLYKGLAYLATGDARNAGIELTAVVVRTKPGDELYEAARWYLALDWLKRSDVDGAEARSKALSLAREISHGYSRYRESAREMIRVLGS